MALYIAPSVTPWRYKTSSATGPKHNPSFRLIKYDRTTGRHLDLVQYYMDLPESNKQNRPIWTIAYTATTDMGIPDLSPRSMDNFATRTKNPNGPEFQNHLKWRNANAEVMPCDALCHSLIYCNYMKLHEHEYKTCLRDTQQYTASILGKRKWHDFVVLNKQNTCSCDLVHFSSYISLKESAYIPEETHWLTKIVISLKILKEEPKLPFS